MGWFRLDITTNQHKLSFTLYKMEQWGLAWKIIFSSFHWKQRGIEMPRRKELSLVMGEVFCSFFKELTLISILVVQILLVVGQEQRPAKNLTLAGILHWRARGGPAATPGADALLRRLREESNHQERGDLGMSISPSLTTKPRHPTWLLPLRPREPTSGLGSCWSLQMHLLW